MKQESEGCTRPAANGVLAARGVSVTRGAIRSPRFKLRHVALVAGLAAGLLGAAPASATEDLMRVYNLALRADPEYQSEISANLVAQEATPQARAALLPEIAARYTVDNVQEDLRRRPVGSSASDNYGRQSFALTLRQPVYRQNLWVGLKQAGLQVAEADLILAAAQQTLMLRAADRYFEVLRARALLRSTSAAREAFGEQLEQAQQRFEVGLIAITDVEEARAGFDRARANEISATNGLDSAYEFLREVTGEYVDMVADVGDDLELVPPDPNDIDAWTTRALDQNLELGAARLRSETAEREIDRQYSGHLPTIDIVAQHSRFSDRAFDEESKTWTSFIGVEVNVPIFSGGATSSRTREARALYSQSTSAVEQARRSAQRETRNAYLGVESGISRVAALIQAVRSAKSAREAVVAGFDVGTRTSLDVLNADRDLFQADFDLASARYDYILDVLRLKRAAGTLAESDLEATNALLR